MREKFESYFSIIEDNIMCSVLFNMITIKDVTDFINYKIKFLKIFCY